MNCRLTIFFLAFFISSCSWKKNVVYIDNLSSQNNSFNLTKNIQVIEQGDILKIDVQSIIQEASYPFNINTNFQENNLDLLLLNGYLVDQNYNINFPVLGKIKVQNLTVSELENVIAKMLRGSAQLKDVLVKVRKLNSKFSVVGEVKNPGTFNYYEGDITIFQAIAHAGDLLIDGKRRNIKVIRRSEGKEIIYKLNLTDTKVFESPAYFVKNNDVIIVEPNFSKIKSAGFIGNPSSIASISSLLLSITLLLTNN